MKRDHLQLQLVRSAHHPRFHPFIDGALCGAICAAAIFAIGAMSDAHNHRAELTRLRASHLATIASCDLPVEWRPLLE